MPTTVQGKKQRNWAKKGSKTFWKKNRKNKKGSCRRKKNKNKAVIDQSPAGTEEGQPWINLEELLQEEPPKIEFYPGTPEVGRVLRPTRKVDDLQEFKSRVKGRSDSDYAKDPEKHRSVSGWAAFLEEAAVSDTSKMQDCVTLSVTEAETVSGTGCAQDMLFGMRLLESVGLQVELPMILEMGDKGAIDLVDNWSPGGRTRHVAVRQHSLRELKEEDILKSGWIPSSKNSTDVFTKNSPGPLLKMHADDFCGAEV